MVKLPVFIFLCPKIESKQYPWKKKPWTIQIVSEKFWLCVEKKQSPTSIREKNQTPWTIWFFYGYFKNIEFFCHFFIFQKIWQCLALCSCQGYRLIIAGCIKNDYVQNKFYFDEVSMKKSKHREVSDSFQILQGHRIFFEHSQNYTDTRKLCQNCKKNLGHSQNFLDTILGYFTDTVWIVGPHGQAIRI